VRIPPGRAINALSSANAALSDDERFVAVFDYTPATSLSIVDVQRRVFVGEIATPGCSLAYAAGPRRFAMLCADGALLTVTLDGAGREAGRERSQPFFDPVKDPVTEKAVRFGDSWIFVSFEGLVHPVDLSGPSPRFGERWSLLDSTDREEGWRIGGHQHLALHDPTGRLYSLMHQGGPDTHKQPGTELWVYDVAARKRLQRILLRSPASPTWACRWPRLAWPFSRSRTGWSPTSGSRRRLGGGDAGPAAAGDRLQLLRLAGDLRRALRGIPAPRGAGEHDDARTPDALDRRGAGAMTPALDPALRAALRCALALLWLASAHHKLRDPARFRDALAGYRLVPAPLVRAVAAGIAALELALGLALLLPWAGPAPALATAALLALYAAAIAATLARGRRAIDCGCGARRSRSARGCWCERGADRDRLAAALPATGRASLDRRDDHRRGAAALAAWPRGADAALATACARVRCGPAHERRALRPTPALGPGGDARRRGRRAGSQIGVLTSACHPRRADRARGRVRARRRRSSKSKTGGAGCASARGPRGCEHAALFVAPGCPICKVVLPVARSLRRTPKPDACAWSWPATARATEHGRSCASSA
jgi:uncharacterized membrane protein YphA (DoxX/SURF4 family)